MARYLDVGDEIARRVCSGMILPDKELPAVREAATEYAATPAAIARAHRNLADGGVITIGDRRRARVATDARIAAARLLEADRVFRLAGSDDPALQPVLDHVGPAVVPVGIRGSFPGLRALARGSADGAAIHLRPRSCATGARTCCGSGDASRPHRRARESARRHHSGGSGRAPRGQA